MNDWTTLEQDISQVKKLLLHRLRIFSGQTLEECTVAFSSPVARRSPYDQGLHALSLAEEERLTLLLALLPHVQSNFFEACMLTVFPQGGDLPQLGGVKGSHYRGMLPTGETVQFLLSGNDLPKRLQVQQMLTEGRLIKENILWLETVKGGEPVMSGRLILSEEWLSKLLTAKEAAPKFSAEFPAQKVTTQMQWDDLVLNQLTLGQINDLVGWAQHNETVMQDPVLGRKLKPGYRVLFYGPPGTGKTLTAALIGKQVDKEVYRIDLSQVVSKYIGETEKNLEKLFTRTARKDWILFFDEADALFGKRTNVKDAHDRYANQEVSYLLQRVEDFPGLIILASNVKSNIDEAFLRRFHNIIHFPAPTPAERLKLWQNSLPAAFQPEASIDLAELSEKYELNGAAILHVVHSAALRSAGRKDGLLRRTDLIDAIRKEFRKQERSMG